MSPRNRMILDMPEYVQMAIRLRAVKTGRTTGQVIEEAVRQSYPQDVLDAEEASILLSKQRLSKSEVIGG